MTVIRSSVKLVIEEAKPSAFRAGISLLWSKSRHKGRWREMAQT